MATVAARFLTSLCPDGGCLLWTGAKDSSGYGRMWVGGRLHGAHRIAWELAHGPVPAGMYVLHRCDRRACVLPAHLFLGDHQENMDDMAAKGRRASLSGEANPRAKLTIEQVQEVQAAVDGGESHRSIAGRLGVSRSLIGQIARGKRWSSVMREFPA